MPTVRLEVLPWLTRTFGATGPGRLVREEEVAPGATVRDLFERLAGQHQGFAELVFDQNSRELSGLVCAILNDTLLDIQGGLDVAFADGDTILIVPAFSGGS
ncbi:MAG: MoaD/ThiS family protein [Chloroflexi bacterium]|nr:MoaD/ThiS family protein [Chloroflexota bacterium]